MPEYWPGMAGDPGLIRIGAGLAGSGGCPARQAAKARPAMRPARSSRARKPVLDQFPLRGVMDALDEAEFGGRSQEEILARLAQPDSSGHAAVSRWQRHAARNYLASAALIVTQATEPVSHYWVAQRSADQVTWELYAWGRRYQSCDGTVREHRLIRYGSATGRERDMAEVGLAAYTTAHGKPASWPDPWSAHFETSAAPAPAVRRVRVVEIGLLDGSCAVLFEGTPEEAEGLYRTHTHDRIRAVSSGRSADPGTVCGDCKLITACDSLPRLPGLLGISDPAAPLRRWSVTNGRHYDRCPAQDHLLRLHLPKENEYGPEAVRGQAVHEWLATNHGGGFNAVCTIWDIPPVPDDWTGGRWHVTGDQARYGAQMLASHADVCPFHRSGQITQVRVEPELTFHDAAANVVVTARPDLMYTDDGAWVWRETKTRMQPLPAGLDLLREVPQLALAVLLMSANALGGNPDGARIELEWLTPQCGDVVLLDPHYPGLIRAARDVINGLAAPWHADETARARPGQHCARCPVRRWCPDAEIPDAERPDAGAAA
ncbi:MAG TPA: PD-(D/E)XK nuclease family protein [Streptosporangiaceae bacterium]|nr:PD-(D/E)XK nuclease family protein [Streptosporangiaceae bacterium]